MDDHFALQIYNSPANRQNDRQPPKQSGSICIDFTDSPGHIELFDMVWVCIVLPCIHSSVRQRGSSSISRGIENPPSSPRRPAAMFVVLGANRPSRLLSFARHATPPRTAFKRLGDQSINQSINPVYAQVCVLQGPELPGTLSIDRIGRWGCDRMARLVSASEPSSRPAPAAPFRPAGQPAAPRQHSCLRCGFR